MFLFPENDFTLFNQCFILLQRHYTALWKISLLWFRPMLISNMLNHSLSHIRRADEYSEQPKIVFFIIFPFSISVGEGYVKDDIKTGSFQLVLCIVDTVNSKQTWTNLSGPVRFFWRRRGSMNWNWTAKRWWQNW